MAETYVHGTKKSKLDFGAKVFGTSSMPDFAIPAVAQVSHAPVAQNGHAQTAQVSHAQAAQLHAQRAKELGKTIVGVGVYGSLPIATIVPTMYKAAEIGKGHAQAAQVCHAPVAALGPNLKRRSGPVFGRMGHLNPQFKEPAQIRGEYYLIFYKKSFHKKE